MHDDNNTFCSDIRRGNMITHHPSKEQASSRTNEDGKKYVRQHIPRQKNKHMGKRKDKPHRRDWKSQETEVDLGRARQQHTR